MNINTTNRIQVSTDWSKVEDLIKVQVPSFTFDSSKTYQIQTNIGGMLIGEFASGVTPVGKVGFRMSEKDICEYKVNGTDILWAKSVDSAYMNICEKGE